MIFIVCSIISFEELTKVVQSSELNMLSLSPIFHLSPEVYILSTFTSTGKKPHPLLEIRVLLRMILVLPLLSNSMILFLSMSANIYPFNICVYLASICIADNV